MRQAHHPRLRKLFPVLLLALASLLPARAACGQSGHGRGRLEGAVTDEAGRPVASAAVRARFLEKARPLHGGAEELGFQQESAVDSLGHWRFLGLGTGWWRVDVYAEGYEPASIDRFVMQLYESPPLAVKLRRPGSSKAASDSGRGGQDAGEMFKLRGPDVLIYEKLLVEGEDPEAALLALASLRLESGDHQGAAELFGRVLERTEADPMRRPLAAAALAGRGEALFRRGDWDGAARDLGRSFEIRPQSEITAFDLGEIFFAQKKGAQALRFYREAARLSPDWSDPLEKLGNACLHEGDLAGAAEAFRRFLSLEPQGARAVRIAGALEELERLRRK